MGGWNEVRMCVNALPTGSSTHKIQSMEFFLEITCFQFYIIYKSFVFYFLHESCVKFTHHLVAHSSIEFIYVYVINNRTQAQTKILRIRGFNWVIFSAWISLESKKLCPNPARNPNCEIISCKGLTTTATFTDKD